MPMHSKLKKLASLFLVCPLTACATPIAATDSGCKSFKPITWSKADTEPTKRQVVGHNKAYDTICTAKG